MIYKFTEWMKARRLVENSSESDPFISLQQKQGDFVYFGVHDLARQYKESGSLPKLDVDTLMKKIGQCVDADHVEQTVKVYCEQDPFHFGYHKLETPDARKKRRSKMDDDTHEVDLPVSSLQDITHMLADKGQLGDHKIWLVIDGHSKFQQNLMREIRKKEVSKRNEPGVDFDNDDPQFDMDEPEDEDQKSDDTEYMDLAHYDPSFTSHNRQFKRHYDVKIYDYYPE